MNIVIELFSLTVHYFGTILYTESIICDIHKLRL